MGCTSLRWTSLVCCWQTFWLSPCRLNLGFLRLRNTMGRLIQEITFALMIPWCWGDEPQMIFGASCFPGPLKVWPLIGSTPLSLGLLQVLHSSKRFSWSALLELYELKVMELFNMGHKGEGYSKAIEWAILEGSYAYWRFDHTRRFGHILAWLKGWGVYEDYAHWYRTNTNFVDLAAWTQRLTLIEEYGWNKHDNKRKAVKLMQDGHEQNEPNKDRITLPSMALSVVLSEGKRRCLIRHVKGNLVSDMDQYYQYHKARGQITEDYCNLRHDIERLICNGHL